MALPGGSELAKGYVSLSVSTKGMGKQIQQAMGKSVAGAEKIGTNAGNRLTSGLTSTLKKGAVAAGAVAGTALGTSLMKGFDRLKAIEQSEAKLTGLGHSTEGVAKIMDNALGSVKGTAYGLGDAASVAAGMVASGIKPGEELEQVLKTMGDTAAISGRELTDMGLIFQSVAARGKLQGDDMMQLMSSGIPVLQLLGDELGKTSAEVSDMVSNGEIDFETFEAAMRKGMGGAALEMGNTFSGSLDNMKAAMGRFGEVLLSDVFSGAPTLFGKITDGFDAAGDSVKQLFAYISGDSQRIEEAFGAEGAVNVPAHFDTIANAVYRVQDAIGRMAGAAELFFTGNFTGGVREKLGIEEDDPLVDQILNIRDIFRDWGERVGEVFRKIGEAGALLAPSFATIATELGKAAAKVSAATWESLLRIIEALIPALEKVLVPAMEKLATTMEENPGLVTSLVSAFAGFRVLKVLSGPVKAFTGTIGALSKGLGTAKAVLSVGGKGSIVTALKGFGAAAGKAAPAGGILAKALGGLSKVGGSLSKVFGAVVPWVGKFGKIFFGLITKINPVVAIISTVAGVLTWFFTKTETGQKVFEALKNVMSTVWDWIRDTFIAGLEWAKDTISNIWEGISDAANVAWEGMKLAWETYGQPVLDFIIGAFDFFWEGIKLGFRLLKATFEVAWTALKMAWDAFGQPMVDWIIGAFQNFWGGIKTVFGWIKIGWNILWQGLKLAWDTIGAPIVNFVKGAFSILWTGLSTVFGWIKTGWNLLWQALQTAWNTIGQPVVDFIVRAFNIFKDGIGRAFDTVKGFAEGLWNSISEWFGKIADKVGGIKDEILGKFKGAKDWLVEAGGNIIDGLLNGIGDLQKKIGDWFLDKIPGWIKEPFKKALDIHSPSRVFRGFGQNIGQGLINGIDGMGSKVENAAQRMADKVAGADMPTMSVQGEYSAPDMASQTVSGSVNASAGAGAASASFAASGDGMSASVTGTINPAMEMADGAIGAFGQTVTDTAQGVVTPQIGNMASNIMDKVSGVIAPAMTNVQTGLTQTGSWFTNRVGTIINPVWNAMGNNVRRVQQAVSDPAMAAIRGALTQTGLWFQNRVQTVMNPMWNSMGANVQRIWNSAVNPTFGALRNGLTQTASWFGTAVSNMSTAWARLRAGTGRPARFVVESVFNNGIRKAWNGVAEMIDGKPVGPIGLGNLGAYKTGGVLPGYTPGRDVHQFTSPSGGRIMLSGGEAIMRPEWTRAVGGKRAVDRMNAAARSGKLSKRAKEESKANGYHQAFAEGGIVQAMTRIVKQKYPQLTMTSGQAGRTGGLHGAGMAADFSNGSGNTPAQLALARDIAKTYPNSAELIYDSPGWSNNIKNGQNVGAFGGFYNMAQAGPHHHHVHWGMNTPPTMPFGGGVFAGGSSGGVGAVMDPVDMIRGEWDATIKKIPDYKGNAGSFDKAVPKLKEKMVSAVWGHAKKQAEKLMASGPAGAVGSPAELEKYRPGIKKAFKRQGEQALKPRVDALLRQIWTESKGDPNIAQQIVDMNGTGESAGVGLYQVIPTTWAGYRDPTLPNDRRNVWAAHNFAVRYFRDRHNWNMGPGGVGLPNTGWKTGGVLPLNLPKALLYDDGGYLEDGTAGVNASGKPEPVFTAQQWAVLRKAVNKAINADWRDLPKATKDVRHAADKLLEAAEVFSEGGVSKAVESFETGHMNDILGVFGFSNPKEWPLAKAAEQLRDATKEYDKAKAKEYSEARGVTPTEAELNRGQSITRNLSSLGGSVAALAANPNPATAAKAVGSVVNISVDNPTRAFNEYRKLQAKASAGAVGV